MLPNLEHIIITTGYLGIFFIIFAESGLLFGFFLPGDSLMLTAGLLASRNYFDIKLLVFLSIIAAVSGDTVGYWFGRKVGPKIFRREDSLLFHKKNIVKANEFYQKHGGKTIVFARFLPFIRTFAPIVAGVGTMNYRHFASYNIFGGILWVLSTCLGGYYLGTVIPGIDRYFLFIIMIIILVSALPGLVHFWKEYRQSIFSMVKKKIKIFNIF